MGSTVNIGTPSNNTVSTSVLQNGAVTNDKVSSGAAIARTKLANVDLVDDTSPQLGGTLDSNGHVISVKDSSSAGTNLNRLKVGTHDDLHIWHNSGTNNSNISAYSGDLYIQGNNGSGTAQNQIAIKSNAAVELNYQGTKKFETLLKGVGVKSALLITDAHNTLTGTPFNYFFGAKATNQGGITIEGAEPSIELVGSDGGGHGASILLRNLNDGFFINNAPDNNLLEIKHFTATADQFYPHDSGANVSSEKTCAQFRENGAVELFHNDVKKVETTDTGLRLQGASGDNLFESGRIRLAENGSQMLGAYVHYDGSANKFFLGVHPSTDSTTSNDVNGIELYRESADMYVRLNHAGNERFKTTSYGTATAGDAYVTGDLLLTTDNGKATFGGSNDLQIYHDGSTNIINGAYHPIEIRHGSEKHIRMADDGEVELFHNDSPRLKTTSTGVIMEHSTRPVFHLRCTAPGSGNTDPRGLINFTSQSGDNDPDMYRINFWEGDSSNEIAAHSHASIRYHGDATHGGSGAISFRNENDTSVLFMSRNGNGGTSGSWTVGSDSRKKENITTVANPLTKLSQLRGVDFKWLEKYGGHDCSGVIAQEVEAVLPHLVNEHGAEKNQDGSTMKSVNYDGLWGVMIEAVKELTTKVTTLETKVAALEAA